MSMFTSNAETQPAITHVSKSGPQQQLCTLRLAHYSRSEQCHAGHQLDPCEFPTRNPRAQESRVYRNFTADDVPWDCALAADRNFRDARCEFEGYMPPAHGIGASVAAGGVLSDSASGSTTSETQPHSK